MHAVHDVHDLQWRKISHTQCNAWSSETDPHPQTSRPSHPNTILEQIYNAHTGHQTHTLHAAFLKTARAAKQQTVRMLVQVLYKEACSTSLLS
jgi:hypothetical protein